MAGRMVTIDGNAAAVHAAHAVNEVIAIYPITPSSPMGELADEKSSKGEKNIWGTVPLVVEMQAEGGAAGTVHGALQTGAKVTTFTASQGLLLMIPNMFKIAGELTSTVFHVSARSVATHALSIFGDHSDVMAARTTGFGFLASGSIQEVMDMGLIAEAASLEARVPFVHFFDGFRSSHEIQKVEELAVEDVRAMIDDDLVMAHRSRAMTPDRPVLRGTAQNPDVFFQSREACNKYYQKCPAIVQKAMDKFARIVGRSYHLFDYVGHPEAERIVVLMTTGTEAAHEAVEYLVEKGERVGVIKVHLYRPWDVRAFLGALPKTVKAISVLDRTKEPGALGEPLYMDVRSSISEAMSEGFGSFKEFPTIVGGRYGLSSKEFTPAMVKAALDNLSADKPKNHFTVGIEDDVTGTSLEVDYSFSVEKDSVIRAMFYGLGADGTVGANKNSIKIIGGETDNYAQGYFVYDSRKAGSLTISHLRFGPDPIRSTYLVNAANFVACHQFGFLQKFDMLGNAVEGATFLINTAPWSPDKCWDNLPKPVQETIIRKKLKLYAINASDVAAKTGMGRRVNTIMQTCFFAISGVLPKDEAIAKIKESIKKTYGKKGDKIVKQNFAAVDGTLKNLKQIKVPAKATSKIKMRPPVPEEAPDFVKQVTAEIIVGRGDKLPVSKMPVDGTFPTGTTQWEKRAVALQVPVWDSDLCIQCGKCSLVCPHGVIRLKLYDPERLEGAPESFKSADARGRPVKGMKATIQIAPDDCTGCGECITVCPVKEKKDGKETGRKAINFCAEKELPELREKERKNWKFFLGIPEGALDKFKISTVKGSQLRRPLFEFSGACAGCGETPYVKLLTQLFGDRCLIGNATGCSSIYGGNLPTTPYTTDSSGRGPTWSNSLFEDNAEFGFGMRLTLDKFKEFATELLGRVGAMSGHGELVKAIKGAKQVTNEDVEEQRKRVVELKKVLAGQKDADAKQLLSLADYLVKKDVWVLGGDGWAYDIGYGGLDHVLAQGRDINVLVLDTEVYSNTGGQMSKATPRGAVAKFAAGGKQLPKKDLGMMAMTYGNIYVAKVAFGYSDSQTVKAFVEAESYEGPSLIIAYSHCISHGINMTEGILAQKRAVESGAWVLYRYDPRLAAEGKNPLQLDSKAPNISYEEYTKNEIRFATLFKSKPEEAKRLQELGQQDANARWKMYEQMAALDYSKKAEG